MGGAAGSAIHPARGRVGARRLRDGVRRRAAFSARSGGRERRTRGFVARPGRMAVDCGRRRRHGYRRGARVGSRRNRSQPRRRLASPNRPHRQRSSRSARPQRRLPARSRSSRVSGRLRDAHSLRQSGGRALAPRRDDLPCRSLALVRALSLRLARRGRARRAGVVNLRRKDPMSLEAAADADAEQAGLFEPRRIAFIESIANFRPRMHRYCARMTGSALDGEDVMQEAIFEAYLKLGSFDTSRPLGPWLLRIAHNRCIDFLRRRQVRLEVEAEAALQALIPPTEAVGKGVDRAIERLVIALPPKERACVLLKDVFDYSLEEIADLVESTTGGVKAALNRGRGKLAMLADVQPPERKSSKEELALLRLYVDRFNRRDWQGVRELASADARLRVADCFAGRLADSPYFVEYERPIVPWRMALGEVDGETVVVILRDDPQGALPFSAIRIGLADGKVTSITDYIKCSWIFETASVSLRQP